RDVDTLLDDLLIAELSEALRRAQDSLQRASIARAEERRKIRLTRLRVREFPESAELAQAAIDVTCRHHALPVAALYGAGSRRPPPPLGAHRLFSRRPGVDARELNLPGHFRVGADDLVSQELNTEKRQDCRYEHRDGGQGQRVRPAARPGLSHDRLHVA